MSAAFEVARDFAEHGHRVLPLHTVGLDGSCTCSKPGCSSPGKHPRLVNGASGASSDERQLLAWDHRWPDANWGVALDHHFAVVDLDPKHGADPAELLDELGLAATVWTGDCDGIRGAHVYCDPAGAVATDHQTSPVTGIEVRAGAGRYVVLPGSRHVSGVSYEWANGLRPWREQLPAVPERLRPLQQPASGERRRTPASDWVLIARGVDRGARNQAMARLTGHLLRRRLDPWLVLALIQGVNRQNRPPLPVVEVERIVDSICKRELAR